jgi:hypothetical protein
MFRLRRWMICLKRNKLVPGIQQDTAVECVVRGIVFPAHVFVAGRYYVG